MARYPAAPPGRPRKPRYPPYRVRITWTWGGKATPSNTWASIKGSSAAEENMTRDGQIRHERCGTALTVVVERIPKTTLGRRVVFVEGVEG